MGVNLVKVRVLSSALSSEIERFRSFFYFLRCSLTTAFNVDLSLPVPPRFPPRRKLFPRRAILFRRSTISVPPRTRIARSTFSSPTQAQSARPTFSAPTRPNVSPRRDASFRRRFLFISTQTRVAAFPVPAPRERGVIFFSRRKN